MVGQQTEGDGVLSCLRADFWRRDGNTFPFIVPPEGESIEIQSQGPPLEWHVQDTLSLESARALCPMKTRGKVEHREE